MTSWWDVATAWEEQSGNTPHGRIEARLAQFAASLGVVVLTVRRAASALHFAKRLTRQGRLGAPEELRGVAITQLLTLQRMDRLDPGRVDELLLAVLGRAIDGRSLVAEEKALRWQSRLGGSAQRSHDAGVLRMEAKGFKGRVLDLLALPGSPVPGRLVALGSGDGLRPLSIDALSAETLGGRRVLRGVRVFPAVAGSLHTRRLDYTALLGLWGGLVLDCMYLVFEEAEAADWVAEALSRWGSVSSVVLWLDEERRWHMRLGAGRSAPGPSLDRQRRACVRFLEDAGRIAPQD